MGGKTRVTLFELFRQKDLGKFGIKVINLLAKEIQKELLKEPEVEFPTDAVGSTVEFDKTKEPSIGSLGDYEEESLVEFVKMHPTANFFIDDFCIRYCFKRCYG